MNYYISHLVQDELPKAGLRKVFFYTTKDENIMEKFYWGRGHSAFSKDDINKKVARGVLILLPVPLKLEIEFGIWIDSQGNVFYADLVDPFKNKTFVFKI